MFISSFYDRLYDRTERVIHHTMYTLGMAGASAMLPLAVFAQEHAAQGHSLRAVAEAAGSVASLGIGLIANQVDRNYRHGDDLFAYAGYLGAVQPHSYYRSLSAW